MPESILSWRGASGAVRLLGGVVAAAAVLTVGCDIETLESGPDQTEEVSFNPGGVETATVELHLGAGELNVHGGATKLAEGDLEYNIPSLKPVIRQTTAGHFARLRIDQPESHGIPRNMKYRWNLQLSDAVPISLNVACGAGQARLTVGELHLREVEVHIGAGQIDLDLRGRPTEDYNVTVSGGVGQTNVWLPQDTGIRAEAHRGIGEVRVTGLEKHGGVWESSNYGSAKANIRLKVNGGIGEIRIIGAE
jgi:hypothetical protein